MEEVITKLSAKPDGPYERERKAICVAVDAWALARRGHSKESELQIERVRELSTGFGPRDSAAVEHLIGTSWLAIERYDLARAAFQETLNLFPYGDIGLQARRSLDRLHGTS
jgi:hypothetical protein